MKRRILAAALLPALPLTVPPMSAQSTGFRVTNTFHLNASGGYDYMAFDPSTHLLYIAQGTQVLVFDVEKRSVTHVMTGMSHTHGFVFASDGKTGYVSDGGANVIRIFDRTSFQQLGEIPVGMNPDGRVIEPTTGHLFVFNGKSKNLMIVDLGQRKVIATMPVPGKPEFPTADGAGFVYDNIEDTHELLKISTADNKKVATWKIAGCESPSGMAIDAPAHRITAVCENGKMPVIDTSDGKVVSMPPIGTGPDAVVFDAARNLYFSSNGDAGTLSVVQHQGGDKYVTIGTVKTAPKGRTLALDARTGEIYIVAPDPASSSPLADRPLVLLEVGK